MDSNPRRLGAFTRHEECRFCRSRRLRKFLDFGNVPLAGAFLKSEDFDREEVYPLEVNFCEDCALVQVSNAVPGDVLFKNYFYFSSAIGTLVKHFDAMADEIAETVRPVSDPFVVELGCNDGVLLKPLLARGVRSLGVDPASNVVARSGLPPSRVVNDYFTEEVAQRIALTHGHADVVVSSFSFAHIDDMIDVMKGVTSLLKDDGVFIFEVYYLGLIIDELQYDMIYHEHMSYYSLTALTKFMAQFDMQIFDLKRIELRAGTVRFKARRRGHDTEPSQAMADLVTYEQQRRLDSLETFVQFGDRVAGTKRDLIALLDTLKQEGRRVAGYGASGRATTIMNYCGIDGSYLDYVVDDAPAKHGYFTPGTHVPIRAWPEDGEPVPDYFLVFAWSFIDEVKRRRADYLRAGGHFIVPLPTVQVFSEA